MLLPLMGFVMGCVVFAVVGLIVLNCVPALRLTLTNLALFVAGAFPGTFALMILYSRTFAGAQNQLTSTMSVIGLFLAMLIGAVGGGVGTVWLETRVQ